MKKFYILIAFLLFTGFIIAQSLVKQQHYGARKTLKADNSISKSFDASKFIYNKKGNKSSEASAWYSYAELWQDSLYPGATLTGLGGTYFAPDTLCKGKYGSGASTVYWGVPYHGLAVLLDPTAPIFMTKMPVKFDPNKLYTVDSINFMSTYFRSINCVDTLIVEVITGWIGPTSYFDDVNFPWVFTDYGVDTLRFGDIYFQSPPDYSNPPAIDYRFNKYYYDSLYTANGLHNLHYYRYTKLLKDSDTLSFPLNWMKIATPGVKPDSGKIILTFQYKPGYPYEEGDTLTGYQDKKPKNHKNSMLFYSFEENKYTTQLPLYMNGDWNISCTIPTWATDEDPSVNNGWYDEYIPQWVWSAPDVYDNHWVETKLSYNLPLGITENQAKTIMLSQNIPNPANNSTLINYQLQGANNVSFVVTDMTGREVMNINQGRQSAGSHSITLYTAKLANGMYYYTLNADKTKLTRKMIVNK